MFTSKQAQSQSADQDMDQILVQIRKIIADDPSANGPAGSNATARVAPVGKTSAPVPPPVRSDQKPAAQMLTPVPATILPAGYPQPSARGADAKPDFSTTSQPSAALTAAFSNSGGGAAIDDDLSDLFEGPDASPKVAPLISTVTSAIPLDVPERAAAQMSPVADRVAPTGASAAQLAPTVEVAQVQTDTSAAPSAPAPIAHSGPVAAVLSISAVSAEAAATMIQLPPVSQELALPPAAPAAQPPPAGTQATGPAPSMNFATLTGNRVDQLSGVRAPSAIPLPSYITARAFDAPSIAPPVATVAAPAVVPEPPVTSAPVVKAGSALGELAAGLAASGLVTGTQSVAPQPPTIAVAAAAPTVEGPSVVVPVGAQTDLGPVLQQWLDDNLPRIVGTAIKDALPDLLKTLKS